MTKDRYPYVFSDRSITVDRVDLLVRLSEGSVVADIGINVKFTLKISDEPVKYELAAEPNLGEALHIPGEEDIGGSPGEWILTLGRATQGSGNNQPTPKLNPDAVEDISLIVHYKVG